MTYYLSVFCTDGDVPTTGQVLASTAGRGPRLGLGPPGESYPPEDMMDSDWHALMVFYGQAGDAFGVTIYRAGQLSDNLDSDIFAETVRSYRQCLERLTPSPPRDMVLDHLAHSKFLVLIRIPLSQFGDDKQAWQAVDALVDYFVDRHGGLVHAEGEGFYDTNGRLLVPLQ
jgi:hypothetical protein